MLMQFLKQSFILLLAAVFCAAITNGLAGKERKLSWIGNYPGALEVPEPGEAPPEQIPAESKTRPQTRESASSLKAPAPQSEPAEQTGVRQPAAQQSKRWTAVSGKEAWTFYLQHALFLDARRSEEYAAGRIAGARSFSVWEGDIDTKLQQLPAEGIPPDFPIVTYCSGGSCEDSVILAEKLADLGYARVFVYRGGLPEWQEQGRPVEGEAGQ